MKTGGEEPVAQPLGNAAVNKWVFVAKLGDDDSGTATQIACGSDHMGQHP
jgi:hypothetical protein